MGRGSSDSRLTQIDTVARADAVAGERWSDRQSGQGWQDRVRGGVAALLSDLDGAEAWEVGGSLRDTELGREPKDLDVCVVGIDYATLFDACSKAGTAKPLETAGQLIGVRLRAPWTPKEGIELALARTESSTGPAHSDFAIDAGADKTIEDDLRRRDFSCNAIARRIEADGSAGKVLDPFGGCADIAAGTLRQTNPHALDEDPLRTLRGLVRVSRDGLHPDAETAQAMRRNAAALAPDGPLSAERKIEQLDKLLLGANAAQALRLARELGVYEQVFPELQATIGFDQESRYHSMSVDEHCLQALERACETEAPLSVRWAALLHDAGKPKTAWRGADGRLHYYANPVDPGSRPHEVEGAEIARGLLGRLRATNELTDQVSFLIAEHMYKDDDGFERRSETKQGLKARRFIARVGRERAAELLLLRRCDRAGKRKQLEPGWDRELAAFEKRVRAEWDQPLTLKELEIDGKDVLALGLRGPAVGSVLAELRHRVVCDPGSNRRERLLGWAERLARSEADRSAVA